MPWIRDSGIGALSRNRSAVFALAVLTLFARPGLAQNEQAPAQPPPPAVGVVEAAEKDVTPSAEFIGRVEAVERVDLRARVTGFLDNQEFEDGQDVEKGKILFIIEQAPFDARVQEAKANLEAAKAQQENAKFQLDRAEELVKRGNIPEATVDERRADYLVAKASVLQTEAALQNAIITYDYTQISTPIDGRIGRANVKVGNLVSPESGVLATVVRTDPMYVTFNVSERQYLSFRRSAAAQPGSEGDQLAAVRLRLRLSDGEMFEHDGTLDFADVQVDQTTDTVALRGTFPNAENLLIDGQFIIVVAQSRTPRSALVVPRSTVGVDQRGAFVMVVGDDNKVEQRVITMGPEYGQDVVVENGLKAGEKIIAEGLTKVRPGMVVAPSAASTLKDNGQ